jgi:RNA methyltransferase, TrmH family
MVVRELFVTPDAAGREVDLLRAADGAEVPITLVDDRVCARLTDTQHPQGVVAIVGTSRRTLTDVLRDRPRLVTVLCRVADPGNAGTVIRTSDAAGAAAVVLTRGSVDPYAGKCVRATAGSLFHLPVVTGVTPGPTVTALREAGLTVLAATVDGDDLDTLSEEELRRPTAWLFGSEAHGLDREVEAGADHRVRVPIHGGAESLNLAAAAAVCLYASARAQHR